MNITQSYIHMPFLINVTDIMMTEQFNQVQLQIFLSYIIQ